jgi:hypothetical protein
MRHKKSTPTTHHHHLLVVVVATVAVLVLHAAPFPADTIIDDMDAGFGTWLVGTDWGTSGNLGYAVAGGGGDIDGDGIDDLIVSAVSAGATEAGRAYVLYGVDDPTTAWPQNEEVDVVAQDTNKGRIIDGGNAGAYLGTAVAVVGDVNNDGKPDYAIGSPDSGKVWLVWGKEKSAATNPLYVNTLDASKFVEITGEAPDNYFGWSIAGGDFNHDDISDLLISAPFYSSGAGRSYIVWGHNGTWPATINAADIGEVTVGGVKIIGEAGSWSGVSVANAGDVNHDGKTDLIIGAPHANPSDLIYAGRAYIVFGKDSGTWPMTTNLGSLTAADGVIINGVSTTNGNLGWSVSGKVDVNGDNTADVIVGAYWADPDAMRTMAGITYVVFGSATLPSVIDASDDTFFDGTKGFKLFGEGINDNSGNSVSGAGDVNGDGIGDIIIGAPKCDNTATMVGRSYVVFGHRGAWPAVVEL